MPGVRELRICHRVCRRGMIIRDICFKSRSSIQIDALNHNNRRCRIMCRVLRQARQWQCEDEKPFGSVIMVHLFTTVVSFNVTKFMDSVRQHSHESVSYYSTCQSAADSTPIPAPLAQCTTVQAPSKVNLESAPMPKPPHPPSTPWPRTRNANSTPERRLPLDHNQSLSPPSQTLQRRNNTPPPQSHSTPPAIASSSSARATSRSQRVSWKSMVLVT